MSLLKKVVTNLRDSEILDHNSLEYPLENIIHRFKHHPTILVINKKKFENAFEFHYVDQDEGKTEIKKSRS